MRIHYLQHVPFEGLGYINDWANEQGHPVSVTRLFEKKQFPQQDQFDFLIVMGGPMSIHDIELYPWLVDEKGFIQAAIEAEKPILGICLGAQLLADVLGSRVYKGKQKEIGWFPIFRSRQLPAKWAGIMPAELKVFHWHGETFDLPAGSVHLANSEVCQNQGFVWNERVVALQFHLESTPHSVRQLIDNCADELVDAPFIQKADQMLVDKAEFKGINLLMKSILEYLSGFVRI